MGRFNSTKAFPASGVLRPGTGFTLIELLVVIIILGILIGMMLAILNPIAQIEKAQDAQRMHDLKQLQTALDSYYNDDNYYPIQPLSALITAKSIQAIPNDPAVSSSWPNYAYLNDSSNNPQWNVLFAKLAFPSSSSSSCPLAQLEDSSGNTCLPPNYSSLGYNYCVISGNVDCDLITSPSTTLSPLPIFTPPTLTPIPIPTSPPTPTPPLMPTPTPHPFYCSCSTAIYWIDLTIKDPTKQCLVEQPDSNPDSNFDRYCSYDPDTQSCIRPCSQP
ncbi:MAG: prepilin-type N-terminal cleavage/methylation domain-containing protein [Candidatus Levyibacteriota bacterium]